MLSNYQKNKENIYNWRDTHRQEYNEYMKETMKRAYDKNPDIKRKQNLNRYYFKQECKRLNNILIEH
jgi:hypothetical protein